MRAPNPDEGEVHHAMKGCKNCNDYLHLTRNHQMYCDEPGDPCNDFDGHVKDDLQGNVRDALDDTRNQLNKCDKKADRRKYALIITIIISLFIVIGGWILYKSQYKKTIAPAYVQMTQSGFHDTSIHTEKNSIGNDNK